MKKSILMITLVMAMLSMVLVMTACSSPNYTSNTVPNTAPNTAGAGNTNTQTTTLETNTTTTTTTSTTASEAGRTKLSDSPNANNAYLISGDSLNDAAKTATSGFNIQKTSNPDGTTTISLTSSNPEYKDQSYTLQSGEQLYFIERALGDDSGNQEGNLGDDMAIVVDAQGYIVR